MQTPFVFYKDNIAKKASWVIYVDKIRSENLQSIRGSGLLGYMSKFIQNVIKNNNNKETCVNKIICSQRIHSGNRLPIYNHITYNISFVITIIMESI